jgi:hypothetical protein
MFFENPLNFYESLSYKLGTGFTTVLYYLKLMLYPHPLLFYYGYNMIPVAELTNIYAIISLAIHAGLFILAILTIKKHKILSYGLFFYLVSIVLISYFFFI